MKQNTKKAGFFNFHQSNVLSERYFDVFLGDFTNLFFLIFQPIAVAFFAGMIWQGGQSTATLYFVMIFSCIFFGCLNSCREIVKEKAIFQRERLVGLEIMPYILSKIWVLSAMGLGQTLLFYFGMRYFLVFEGNMILMFLLLYLSLLSGTMLGLFISAFVSTDVMALALVPVFLIPQLLFSKLVMPNRSLSGAVAWMEKATLVKWSYQSMEQIVASSLDWTLFVQGIIALTLMGLAYVVLSALILKFKEAF